MNAQYEERTRQFDRELDQETEERIRKLREQADAAANARIQSQEKEAAQSIQQLELIPVVRKIIGNWKSGCFQKWEILQCIAVAIGINKIEGFDVVQILFRKVKRMLFGNASLVGT